MQKKLFLTYVVIILFLSSVIGVYAVKICTFYYAEDYKKFLYRESAALSYVLKDKYEDNIDLFTKEFSAMLKVRITVIDKNGNVLSDSMTDHKVLDNHINREEIQMALDGKTTFINRYSDTLGEEYMYSATMVDTKKPLILRISLPLLELTDIKNTIIVYISTCVIIASIIAFFCAYFFSKKMSEPLDILSMAVDEISNGNYKKIPVETKDQIGTLTLAFNQMSDKLNSTIHQLENENHKMEAIVNSMINGVLAVDKNLKILMINPMCATLFDLNKPPVQGGYLNDFLDNVEISEMLIQSMKERRHIVAELISKSPLNGDKILRVYANPITSSGKNHVIGSLLVLQDVTQMRKLEELRSDFVSNVTHELKTPLTSIMGFTDTLKAGALDDRALAMRFLDIIDIESNRLYRLIQDILSLSELETRGEDINMSMQSIPHILSDVYKLLRPQAEERNLLLSMEIAKDIPLFLCNRDRFSQMFINLIENAIKYTEKGYIRVICKNQESFLEIKIIDTGIGIPEQSKERIFERFYRVDKGRSRKIGGTGLGLSIVKHIIILYDGRMSLDTKEGLGSTFTITIPYKK